MIARAAAPVKTKSKKRKSTAAATEEETAPSAKVARKEQLHLPAKVAAELKDIEEARKGKTSAAVQSMYAPKNGQEKEGWMTRSETLSLFICFKCLTDAICLTAFMFASAFTRVSFESPRQFKLKTKQCLFYSTLDLLGPFLSPQNLAKL